MVKFDSIINGADFNVVEDAITTNLQINTNCRMPVELDTESYVATLCIYTLGNSISCYTQQVLNHAWVKLSSQSLFYHIYEMYERLLFDDNKPL